MLENRHISWSEIVKTYEVKKVLDIGAFLGGWADGMAALVGDDSILSIEANPHCEASLCKKNRRYRLCCLSDCERIVDFYLNPNNLTSTGESYYKENTPHFSNPLVVKMRTKTLDELIGEEEFDLIKIDVQGCEYDVIQGGNGVIRRAKVVVVETSTSDFDYNLGAKKQEDVVTAMEKLGFQAVCSIENHSYLDKIIQQDILFVAIKQSAKGQAESKDAVPSCVHQDGHEVITEAKTTNVLFVNHFGHVDFLNDHVYEGLVRQPNFKIWETHNPFYMLNGCPDLNGMWGRGIGYGKLTHTPNIEDANVIREKIANRFYDLIVYGSIRRCRDHFDEVTKSYSFDKVLIFDGEDDQGVDLSMTQYGLYFKRELVSAHPRVLPISFAATESAIATRFLTKSQVFGTCIPGNPSTYKWNFQNQREYYKDYNRSFYGITTKKDGWDCNRHYEILASHCVPYFPDLENCPPLTMTNFPKDQVINASKWAAKKMIPSNYEEILNELFEFTKEHLTTQQMVKNLILNKL